MKRLLFSVPVLLLASAPLLPAQSTKPAAPTPPARPLTTQDLYEAGRAAFYRDDFARAKPLLQQVNRLDPKHQPTIILLKNIQLAEQEAAAKRASLEGRMKAATVPRFEVDDAPVTEVIDYLRLKAAQTKGMQPNFIVKLTEEEGKRRVTLKLGQTSLHNLLGAIASATDLEVVYDRFAVTIQKKSAPVPAAGEGEK